MENNKFAANGSDVLSLYKRDCLFQKECELAFVATEATGSHRHIKTQCTRCGYQTGGFFSKKMLSPDEKIECFNQVLYDAVYKKKLEEIYAMSGGDEKINKHLQQIKKAAKDGKLQSKTN